MSEEDENDAVEEGSVITATAAAAEGTATMETMVRENDPGGSEDDTKVVVEEDGFAFSYKGMWPAQRVLSIMSVWRMRR